MPGRTWVGGDRYRYDFNGKESDKEVSSGFQDYGFRVNDTRIGRFFSVDPLSKQYPELTPYQFAANTPIQAIDLDGKEPWFMFGEIPPTTPLLRSPMDIDLEMAVKTGAQEAVKTGAEGVGKTQEHHLIPRQFKADKLVEKARNAGEDAFKFEGKENKMPLEQYTK